MSKHTKLRPPATPTPTAPESETPLMDRAEATLGALLELVEGAINEGDNSPQVLREASGVARAIVAAQAERRASAKARAYTAANLPPEIVMAHLRGLTPDARGRIVTELLAIDNEGSVLA